MKILATKEDINDCISQAIDHFRSINPHYSNFKLCIPWSAGAGKTTAIIDFIAEYWRLGIIYSAGTIEELEIVYRKIIEKLPQKFHNKIYRFHSERPDWEIVKNNPDLLKDHPVIMVTHQTLSTMLPSYLTSRRQGYSETRPRDNVRRYCITDEKAVFAKEFIINKTYMSYLKLLFQNTDIEDKDFLRNYSKLLPLGLETAENVLRGFKGNQTVKLPTQDDLIVEDHMYGRAVRLVTELVYPKIEQVGRIGDLRSPIRAEDTSIIYDISNIEINHINFDGTGDIVFSNSKNWFVPDNKYPYSFKGKFNLIEDFNPIKRKSVSSNNTEETQIALQLDSFIDSIVNITAKSIQEGHKPLVVTWKDLEHKSESSSILSNSDFEITIRNITNIQDRLEKLGFTKDEHYYLTYWYSGETRATNKFRDADEIYLFQNCYLPQIEVGKLRKVFENDSLTTQDLFIAEIVQAIYRTRVRCGLDVTVHFDRTMLSNILKVKDYLGLSSEVLSENIVESENILNTMKIRKNIREDIEKLVTFFGSISVLHNNSLQIKFSDLKRLIPRKQEKLRSYTNLIEALKEYLNCELEII